jgi:nucleoside-diphosphate kinase
MATETTLIVFKSDCVKKTLNGEVLKRLEAEGFIVRGLKMMRLSEAVLREHYAHVADKTFFPGIV